MVFFISDLHFYHFNIIKSCSRPFRDEIEMNEKLIENFNSTVSENDEVYILGDLAYRYPDIQSVNSCIARLSGIKHLVVGNHDIELLKDPLFDRSPFRWIKNYYEFPLTAKKKIVLFQQGLLPPVRTCPLSGDGGHAGRFFQRIGGKYRLPSYISGRGSGKNQKINEQKPDRHVPEADQIQNYLLSKG